MFLTSEISFVQSCQSSMLQLNLNGSSKWLRLHSPLDACQTANSTKQHVMSDGKIQVVLDVADAPQVCATVRGPSRTPDVRCRDMSQEQHCLRTGVAPNLSPMIVHFCTDYASMCLSGLLGRTKITTSSCGFSGRASQNVSHGQSAPSSSDSDAQ